MGGCMFPRVNFELLQRTLFIKQGRLSAWAGFFNYRIFPAVSRGGIRDHTRALQAVLGSPKPASPTPSFFLRVLQPRVVCKCIWHDFCAVNSGVRLPAIIGQLGLPTLSSPTSIASIEIVTFLLFTKRVCVCVCVCVCVFMHVCTCVCPCAHVHTYIPVATQDIVFLTII